MEQYIITGMSCAACSARVEKAVSKVPGVTGCAVNLLTNSMGVEGTAQSEDIILAVEKAGYGAVLKNKKKEDITGPDQASENHKRQTKDRDYALAGSGEDEEILTDRETPKLKKRLLTSLVFLVALMYISMGHVMWGWSLPGGMEKNTILIAFLQFLLTLIVMTINRKFFVNGFRGLIHKTPNMDTLVALGSGAAFGYSTVVLVMMLIAWSRGNQIETAHYLHEFYFESAAMILTLITLGKMLEARSKGKTTDALRGLMKLAPKTATLIIDEQEQEVPVRQVQTGDIFVLRPGAQIPVDGVVLTGSSAVNESALTGESIPVDKTAGDKVSAGTFNQSGYLRCEATRVGEDTTLAQIIQMVSEGAATKAPIAKVADKVSGIFVPAVLLIALVTWGGWLVAGESMGFALARSISVLVISCPCALGLATPVAIMVGSGVGARHGILFKTAASLEETGKAKIVVLDKTGTLTSGEPRVTDMIPSEGISQGELLELAYILEKRSEHPLAKAIVKEAEAQEQKNLNLLSEACGEKQQEHKSRKLPEQLTDFRALPGNGLSGLLEGKELRGGNLKFLKEHVQVPDKMLQKAEALAQAGKTPLFFACDGELKGIIAVADTLKEDSAQAVQELRHMGLQVVMLTGDNQQTAEAIARQAGVDKVIAGVLPEGKEQTIRTLQKQGKVIMVGDGINDAPALVAADMGIAIGAGTDVAVDAAEVVLLKNSLRDVAAAIRLSRSTLRNIHQNLFWAFFYNSIGIPLAAGVFIPILGWQLSPMFGAAAMSLSSFCVVSNALRLNWCKLYGKIERATAPEHLLQKKGKILNQPSLEEADCKSFPKAEEAVRDKESVCREGLGQVTEEIIREEPQWGVKIESEEKAMEKTLKIEGMMCGHCEARVKKVLEAMEQVEAAVVSHKEGTAVVTLKAPVSEEELRKVIEDQDYKVLEIL